MLRQSIIRAARPASVRSFSISTRTMAAGDLGSPKPTGQGDAFSKREKAAEDYDIRQREQAKLKELKQKLAESKAHLEKLEEHIDGISKGQEGGRK